VAVELGLGLELALEPVPGQGLVWRKHPVVSP